MAVVVGESTFIELDERVLSPVDERQRTRHWYALWTSSHCEQFVHEQLEAKGFHPFLPKINVWSRRFGKRRIAPVPMFSGYVFLRHGSMDKVSYIELCKTRGLVRILGERWDRLEVIPDREIDALQRAVDAKLPVTPYPYLRQGQRVRIVAGPLADVEGILVRTKPTKGLVVLSVELLHRSAAVEVDCTLITAA